QGLDVGVDALALAGDALGGQLFGQLGHRQTVALVGLALKNAREGQQLVFLLFLSGHGETSLVPGYSPAQTVEKVLSSRHVRMDGTHTGKFSTESVRAALRRVRGSVLNFVPRGILGGRNFCRA